MSQPSDLAALLQSAFAAHQQAQWDAAAAGYQEILLRQPEHFDALHLLGLVNIQKRNFTAAVQLIERAIALQPRQAAPYVNLAAALRALGRRAEALKRYDSALALDPSNGDILSSCASLLHELGQLEPALANYDRALKSRPQQADWLCNRGDVLQELQRYQEALASYQQAVTFAPKFAAAWNKRGNALRNLKSYEAALASYAHALQLEPNFVEAINNRGNLLRHFHRYPEALACYERALTLQPGYAEAHSNRGNALRELNQLDAARASFQRAVELAPGNVRYYCYWAAATQLTAQDACYQALERFAQHPEVLAPADRSLLHFTLGDALTQLGEHDRAFAHFQQGNAVQRARTRYNEAGSLGLFDWMRSTVTREFIDSRRGGGDPSDAPVFIVGMPRCGSTLIEQVLASHPEVYGAGEYPAFPDVLRQYVERTRAGRADSAVITALAQADYGVLGADYQQCIQQLEGGGRYRRVVDKALQNFAFVGLIHLALPNARFIHARRSPVDTCLSCFSKPFDDAPFSFDLAELGRHYAAYHRLMTHWQTVLPEGVMLDVHYEDMVGDLAGQVSRILTHCDLDWDPACLDFHHTVRPVATLSSLQVREPLYTLAVRRWRPAPDLLAPLLSALGEIA